MLSLKPFLEIPVVVIAVVSSGACVSATFTVAALRTVIIVAIIIISVIPAAEILSVTVACCRIFIPFNSCRLVLYKRTVIEFQFTIGHAAQLILDAVVVHQLFMPVAVGKLHVIRDRIGEALLFLRVLFL